MTATIHYNGKLDNRARLDELLDAARLYCAENRWLYLDVDERILGQVERPAGAGDWNTSISKIDETLQGIVITIHPKADPLRLTFNSANELVYYMQLDDKEYWELSPLFINARAAGIPTHIAVCEFLHFMQGNYLPGLNVYDETGYFETGDFVRAEAALLAEQAAQPLDTEHSTDPFAPDADGDELQESTGAQPKSGTINRNASNSHSSTAPRKSKPSQQN